MVQSYPLIFFFPSSAVVLKLKLSEDPPPNLKASGGPEWSPEPHCQVTALGERLLRSPAPITAVLSWPASKTQLSHLGLSWAFELSIGFPLCGGMSTGVFKYRNILDKGIYKCPTKQLTWGLNPVLLL